MQRRSAGGFAASPVLPPIAMTVAIEPKSISTLVATAASVAASEDEARALSVPVERAPIARYPLRSTVAFARARLRAGAAEAHVGEERRPRGARAEAEVERRLARDGVDRAQDGGAPREDGVVGEHRHVERRVAPRGREISRDEQRRVGVEGEHRQVGQGGDRARGVASGVRRARERTTWHRPPRSGRRTAPERAAGTRSPASTRSPARRRPPPSPRPRRRRGSRRAARGADLEMTSSRAARRTRRWAANRAKRARCERRSGVEGSSRRRASRRCLRRSTAAAHRCRQPRRCRCRRRPRRRSRHETSCTPPAANAGHAERDEDDCDARRSEAPEVLDERGLIRRRSALRRCARPGRGLEHEGRTSSSVAALPSCRYGAESTSPRSAGVSKAQAGRGSPSRSWCATSGHGPPVTHVPTSWRRTPPVVIEETMGPSRASAGLPLPESVFAGPLWQFAQPTWLNTLSPCERRLASASPWIVWVSSVEGGTGAGSA